MITTGEIEHRPAQSGGRRQYLKELKKVVEASDVIIEVLDARDPEGCRNLETEEHVTKQNKKLLFLINKIDLVPTQNARAWKKHLTKEHPCILFNGSIANQS